ncbi:hypothetical protein O181_046201 [Austropuccinia psidii MF-1]|uniref:Uncharacterized protein n=1 Tax=Austropuccinia psidii MF-1 TaxID=1389203 RepID=A0A9Q3HIE9_9BASI|nr:hypothetical protein [Austropuccinia psidii MF-1]
MFLKRGQSDESKPHVALVKTSLQSLKASFSFKQVHENFPSRKKDSRNNSISSTLVSTLDFSSCVEEAGSPTPSDLSPELVFASLGPATLKNPKVVDLFEELATSRTLHDQKGSFRSSQSLFKKVSLPQSILSISRSTGKTLKAEARTSPPTSPSAHLAAARTELFQKQMSSTSLLTPPERKRAFSASYLEVFPQNYRNLSSKVRTTSNPRTMFQNLSKLDSIPEAVYSWLILKDSQDPRKRRIKLDYVCHCW